LAVHGQVGRTPQLEKIVNRKTFGLVLIAVSLSSAACDKSPLEVTGTGGSSLAPAYTSVTTKSLSFNESFTKLTTTPATLEVTGAAPSYSTGAAVFAGSQPSGSDRGYLRTIAANYNTTSFRADITVTIPGGFDGNGIAYFGFGRGEPNCDFFCEVNTAPAMYLRILPSDFFGPKVEATNADGTLDTAYGQGGTGTHRVRIEWNANTRAITLSIMTNYVDGAVFVPTAVMGPYTLGGEFDATNSHIFFGGAGMDSFDDLNVKVTK
jgi:hypothetical protein